MGGSKTLGHLGGPYNMAYNMPLEPKEYVGIRAMQAMSGTLFSITFSYIYIYTYTDIYVCFRKRERERER